MRRGAEIQSTAASGKSNSENPRRGRPNVVRASSENVPVRAAGPSRYSMTTRRNHNVSTGASQPRKSLHGLLTAPQLRLESRGLEVPPAASALCDVLPRRLLRAELEEVRGIVVGPARVALRRHIPPVGRPSARHWLDALGGEEEAPARSWRRAERTQSTIQSPPYRPNPPRNPQNSRPCAEPQIPSPTVSASRRRARRSQSFSRQRLSMGKARRSCPVCPPGHGETRRRHAPYPELPQSSPQRCDRCVMD